jgi:hypothetical protein
MGAEVIVPVMSEASVRFAFLKDPQDIYFGIVQMLA